jgi:hypothetical protein
MPNTTPSLRGESEMETDAKYLVVKGLDFDRMKRWLNLAIQNQKDDPVFSFIASWIGFNYYYASFPVEDKWVEFDKWCKAKQRDYDATTTQLDFLIQRDEFTAFFDAFRQHKIFQESIDFPVRNMLIGGYIPNSPKTSKKQWKDLNTEEILIKVLYRIRNNLFHGQKDADKNKRDLEVTTSGCNFMIAFLTELINATRN